MAIRQLLIGLFLALVALPAEARRVAVLAFDVDSADEAHQPLGRGIANMLITDLQRSGLDVVERERINALMGELELQQSSFVEASTAVEVGRLAGATDVLVGGITESGGHLRIDARLVKVEVGKVHITATADGDSEEFFKVFERLVRDLVRHLDAEATASVERQFAMRQAGSITGAVDYGRAVAAEDAGDYELSGRALAAAARDTGTKNAEKIFAADIRPLPPFFAQLGLSGGPLTNPNPNQGFGVSGGVDLTLGWAISERFFAGTRIGLLGMSFAHELNPTHTTAIWETALVVRPVEAGLRMRLGKLAGHGLYAAGSGGLATGSVRMTNGSRTVARRGFIGFGGSAGADLVMLRHERVGFFVGVHSILRTFSLGDQTDGLPGRGQQFQGGIEARVGYALFGGRR